jgi:hypothetical protein
LGTQSVLVEQLLEKIIKVSIQTDNFAASMYACPASMSAITPASLRRKK